MPSEVNHRGWTADAAGLAALGALVGVLAAMLPETLMPPLLWIFAYLVLAVSALFVWHHPQAPVLPRQWLMWSLMAIAAAASWYAFASIGQVLYGGSEPRMSRWFDLGIMFLFAPGCTFIALAGCIRAIVCHRLA